MSCIGVQRGGGNGAIGNPQKFFGGREEPQKFFQQNPGWGGIEWGGGGRGGGDLTPLKFFF